MSTALCYILLSSCGRYVWCAPGFRLVDDNLHRAQRFKRRHLAVAESARLRRVLNLDSRPFVVRWSPTVAR